jgi:hypothetical protein
VNVSDLSEVTGYAARLFYVDATFDAVVSRQLHPNDEM